MPNIKLNHSGSVAQLVLGTNSYFDICIGFALGAAIGIFTAANLSGKILTAFKQLSRIMVGVIPNSLSYSGAHLNPAVTVALCLTGRSEWNQLPFHWMGQYLGAFLAAALVFGTYSDAINHYDPNHTVPGQANTTTPTAGIFATYPHGEEISNGICL